MISCSTWSQYKTEFCYRRRQYLIKRKISYCKMAAILPAVVALWVQILLVATYSRGGYAAMAAGALVFLWATRSKWMFGFAETFVAFLFVIKNGVTRVGTIMNRLLLWRGGVAHARERLEHEDRKLKETIGKLTVELKRRLVRRRSVNSSANQTLLVQHQQISGLDRRVERSGRSPLHDSGHGCQAASTTFFKACSYLGLRQIFACCCNPKSNTATERVTKTVKEYFVWTREFCSVGAFEYALKQWQKAYNEDYPRASIGDMPPNMRGGAMRQRLKMRRGGNWNSQKK